MKFILLLCSAALLITSCKKTEEHIDSYWKLGPATFKPVTVGRTDKLFYASDPIGLLGVKFASMPTTSGVYTAESITANNNGDDYAGYTDIPVNVTVTNNKITVDLSNRWAIHIPEGKDSLQLSAHLTEQ